MQLAKLPTTVTAFARAVVAARRGRCFRPTPKPSFAESTDTPQTSFTNRSDSIHVVRAQCSSATFPLAEYSRDVQEPSPVHP